MKAKMTITIKKRSQPEWLSWFVVVMPFLFGLLNTFLGLPWAIRYLIDAAWVILTVTILRYQPSHQPKNVKGIAFWVGLFFFYTLFVYLVQYQSFLYYLWGFRNNFRFYAVFFAFVYFLKPVDIDACYSIFDKLFWVNAVVTIFQFLFL